MDVYEQQQAEETLHILQKQQMQQAQREPHARQAEQNHGASAAGVGYHLQEAMAHLETAIQESIRRVREQPELRKDIAPLWEAFLGRFYRMVKEKGKQSGVNLLSWVSFAKLR